MLYYQNLAVSIEIKIAFWEDTCLPKYLSTVVLHKLNENHRVLCQIHTVECYNHNYLINPPLKANTAHFTAKAH